MLVLTGPPSQGLGALGLGLELGGTSRKDPQSSLPVLDGAQKGHAIKCTEERR